MDFSTPEQALKSLIRRSPALEDGILHVSKSLLTQFSSNLPTKEEEEEETESIVGQDVEGILQLLRGVGMGLDTVITTKTAVNSRWESLAVGLYLSMELLDGWSRRLWSKEGDISSTHYVDGPRLPSIVSSTQKDEEVLSTQQRVTTTPSSPTFVAAAGGNTTHALPPLLPVMVQFCECLLEICRGELEHSEPRVRTLIARAIGSHARFTSVWVSTRQQDDKEDECTERLMGQRRDISECIVFSLIHQYRFKRDNGDATDTAAAADNPKRLRPLDDTTGWRALETSLHSFASWIDGCGSDYWALQKSNTKIGLFDVLMVPTPEESQGNENEKETLLHILEQCCTSHVNRHVRAAALQTMEQLVKSAATAFSIESGRQDNEDNPLLDTSPLRSATGRILTVTLGDNWSQVRMAASVLCRTLFLAIKDDPTRVKLYPTLLPRMCLNRFYLAQGVKLYSQETWKLIFSTDGAVQVATHAAQISRFYSKMADADNHVVREAACQAIAELAQKLGTHPDYAPYLAPHVPVLLQALIMCFHDESWPVRDEACLACGTFARAYPDECRPELPVLFSRWVEQITDQIWSVREDAAVALGDAIVAYPYILQDLLPKIKEFMPGAKNQPPQTREEMLATHNNPELHTNSQLYSCGSLAPKLGRGSQSPRTVGGCSNCVMTREKAPWEATDGCIYMIRELCRATTTNTTLSPMLSDDVLLPLMEELLDVCRVRHFPQSDDLRATVWKQLPEIARGLGKQRFKRIYLDLCLDLLMTNLGDTSASQLSIHAAEQCCVQLAEFVGKGILRGRVCDDRQRDALDRCLALSQEGRGMMMGGEGNGMMGSPPQPMPGRISF
mmetsp:Transcript_23801/g.34747  ORF Transcript_23801/g.34747 Transcript_23801/m.34747 type:complete len:844 (-) Transcript_23801:437-2968(-)|eukprot:CAMPEP_0195540030 /NCGR_PEP_ID=MMETSP0794_2-20130614/50364_1 /TAXON_ID=515487 /ORGANISM="Stephanopyxis turris, Strain CCMP 815" /LENGTH=843 /DNA_ID=CAMNT_0040674091 /DNA_START=52 /DNA_END=2583 /DNA_ORIENTATION=-